MFSFKVLFSRKACLAYVTIHCMTNVCVRLPVRNVGNYVFTRLRWKYAKSE